jgi:hypothetical protein
MKKLIALIVCAFSLSAFGQANVLFSVRDFGYYVLSSNVVRLIPTNSTPVALSTNIFVNDWRQQRTDTNGLTTFTNCRAFAYHVTISGPNQTTAFKIQGLPTDGSEVNAVDYIVPIVTSDVARYLRETNGIRFYTNAGALYISATNTSGSSATNAVSIIKTNATTVLSGVTTLIFTNSSTVTPTATSLGGGTVLLSFASSGGISGILRDNGSATILRDNGQ